MMRPTQPLVAVPSNSIFTEGHGWYAASKTYIELCADFALQPLIVPVLQNEANLDHILDVVDGVLIPGAVSNLEPKHYHQEKDCGPYDPSRDAVTLKLIKRSIERKIPILAICRGLQELNVVYGGTLAHNIQDLPHHMDHRAPKTEDRDKRYALAHEITISPDGLLQHILCASKVRVNSLHQQGIDQLGQGLVVEAKAPDGTIEAVSVEKHEGFALGVQWHPEYWAHTDPTSHKIIEAFKNAVYQHQKDQQ